MSRFPVSPRSCLRFCLFATFCALAALAATPISEQQHTFFRNPDVSKTQVVFEYAGDLWTVGRKGGEAHHLTDGIGAESGPHFSPDGSMIAFTGEYEGNHDVYVVPATGGTPRRLTYHPGIDVAVGWTPDGKKVLMMSDRASFTDSNRLYTISLDGSGLPEPLPLSMAEDGSFSPDGTHIAYSPGFLWQPAWKRYRGGQTAKIWIANLADSSVVKIPRENSNDFNPCWIGDTVYFLSDRNGPVSLFAYHSKSGKVSQVVDNDGLDLKEAGGSGSNAIAYEQFGSLFLLDVKSGKSHPLNIEINADLPQVRTRFQKLADKQIENAALSPTGMRAIFEAHGEILTVPAEKGDLRNLTQTPAVADRNPAWSPDGKSVAYFSDESGEYALHIRDQNGLGEVKKISLGKPSSFFYNPVWSPDNKKVAFTDKRLNLWYVALDNGTPIKVDTDHYDSPGFQMTPDWSPDSQWLAYSKQLDNQLHAVFVYSLGNKQSRQLTDGMSDALSASFDKSGKYLYFLASTNVALSNGWIDMSSMAHPVTSSVYVAVLQKDLPSPLAPQSDDENTPKPGEDGKAGTPPAADDKSKSQDKGKDKTPPAVRIDWDGISQRILTVPVAEKNYTAVHAGKAGIVFLLDRPMVSLGSGPTELTVQKYNFNTRKADTIITGITSWTLSNNGEKMLYRQGSEWFITAAEQPAKPHDGALKLAELEVKVDPKAEWRQMYSEVWRIERDFFYDPHFHGLDLEAASAFYRPYLDNVPTRSDLNYLFEEMLGNMTVGHMFIRGGTEPDIPKLKGGLLGADYKVENGRYRFGQIYDGENWNPDLQAPLTQPGVNVKEDEYLLAVRGHELHATDNLYAPFQETAGTQIDIRVGPNPDGSGARTVTVVPIESEKGLRHRAWVEANRRKVDQLSHGAIAYVHLPDTYQGGFTSFNRYFFAQIGRKGIVLDERYNHGGDIADYIIDYLNRKPMGMIATREGTDIVDPNEAIFGPKVMIINQFAGSGGDAMPWYFRKSNLGQLVGMKTWGGLVGIGNYPSLIDGGTVTAPRWAFYGLKGEWEVENHGISPDVEIDMDPKLVREGHDPQLEKAVAVAMEQLREHPLPHFKKPPYPNYHQHFPAAPSNSGGDASPTATVGSSAE